MVTELLIHITAPSRARDDTNFRTLASAYLDFQPARRRDILVADRTEREPATRAEVHPLSPSQSRDQNVITSPHLSFEGAFGNFDSPEIARGRQNDPNEAGADTQSSWHTPPSVVQDSCPDNRIALPQYSSPTRILEYYLSGFESSHSEASPSQRPAPAYALPPKSPQLNSTDLNDRTTSQVSEAGPAQQLAKPVVFSLLEDWSSPELGRHATPLSAVDRPSEPAWSAGFPLTPGFIPDSPPVTGQKRALVKAPTPSESSDDAVIHSSQPSQPPRNEPVPVPSSNPQLTRPFSVSRADSEPPPSKRLKGLRASSEDKGLTRSSSDVGPRQNQEKAIVPRPTQRSLKHREKLMIYSPEPDVGIGSVNPNCIVTERLNRLGKRFDFATGFRPAQKTRELRPFERGYWLVDCSSWGLERVMDAWEFLGNYVGSGEAGWGVWCCRHEGFDWIKVFCWGQVVVHLYFIVYLASRRELKYTPGVSWIGSEGKPVIIMEARARKA